MLFKAVALLGFLSTTVVADGAAIVAALGRISADNANLNNSLLSWDGGLIEALPILLAGDTLENDIKNGTAVANASAPLTTDEAVAVYTAVNSLSADTNITLENFIAAKPKFDKDYITFIALATLKDTKTDVDQFGAAVIAKVPAAYTQIAQGVVAGIDAAFQKAVDVYSS